MSDSKNDNYRIGDEERDLATQSLSEHYAKGRLSIEEFEERTTHVMNAKTNKELSEVFNDLPMPSNLEQKRDVTNDRDEIAEVEDEEYKPERQRNPREAKIMTISGILATLFALVSLFTGYSLLGLPFFIYWIIFPIIGSLYIQMTKDDK